MLKFVDEYYVGFQSERYKTTENQRLLAFLTPKEDNAAFRKRKNTVDNWRDKKIEARVIKNEPASGFRVVDMASRWSTSNKLMRIRDPRGFEFEISISNMLELIKTCTISKGLIVEDLLYARDGARLALAIKDHPDYLTYKKTGGKSSAPEVGSYYIHEGAGIIYRYEGKFGFNAFSQHPKYETSNRGSYRSYSMSQNLVSVDTTVYRKLDKLADVYTVFYMQSDGLVRSKEIHIRKSYLKDLKKVSAPDSKEVQDFKLPMNKILGLARLGDKDYLRVVSALGSYSTKFMLLATKKEALETKYDKNFAKKLYLGTRHNYHSSHTVEQTEMVLSLFKNISYVE